MPVGPQGGQAVQIAVDSLADTMVGAHDGRVTPLKFSNA
jgi:hypothetical protein